MAFISSVFSWLMKKRLHQIALFMKYPHDVQQEWLRKLLNTARNTEWGKKYDYASITGPEEYRRRVPVSTYEDLHPLISKIRKGQQNVLWPTDINWFAKSSGTSAGKSKFIPVSKEALEECHYKGGKDLLSIYCDLNPDTELFDGKLLGMGGSWAYDGENPESYYGDVSAILMQNLPFWVELMRTPSISIALMDEWEQKIEKMARITSGHNVTGISGVPSWTLLLCRRVLEITGRQNLAEVWPKLEMFVHGGVSFQPYHEQFKQIMPDNLHYMETYNASEGFFGIQDRRNAGDMLLMLDYGIFYEFMTLDQLNSNDPQTLGLEEVVPGVNYAMIISTNAGLWRYMIGDTVMFTSVSPYRIHITGRTKSFINAFGEELIIDNAEKAIRIACEKTDARVHEYTAAPHFYKNKTHAAHEWVIEFDRAPDNIEYFAEMLDNALKSLNSDYEAKRYHNMILDMPIIHRVPSNTFYQWMKRQGKLGGQHKVPRLSNSRKYVEDILKDLHHGSPRP
ncbi:MAG TPA: GH3 auxin-responsive promoter family protein [Bacteroidales bacterium]|nr:GH3 auxin-responsive promoter family protein [Bacteroidales bacterium]HSA43432.1 GH3 auxin-responsive promoter family protein [Bacteroidales bacterium]